MMDREALEENVRRLSIFMFKDKMAVFGEVKEQLVKRTVEKAVFMSQMHQ